MQQPKDYSAHMMSIPRETQESRKYLRLGFYCVALSAVVFTGVSVWLINLLL